MIASVFIVDLTLRVRRLTRSVRSTITAERNEMRQLPHAEREVYYNG